MYFIWDFTQLNVRPHSRVGLLKYKTAPKCVIYYSGMAFSIGPIPYNSLFEQADFSTASELPKVFEAHSVIPA